MGVSGKHVYDAPRRVVKITSGFAAGSSSITDTYGGYSLPNLPNEDILVLWRMSAHEFNEWRRQHATKRKMDSAQR